VKGIDTKVHLRLDGLARWNSTFFMLKSTHKYRHPF